MIAAVTYINTIVIAIRELNARDIMMILLSNASQQTLKI
jgi:hypothetical protein